MEYIHTDLKSCECLVGSEDIAIESHLSLVCVMIVLILP